MEDDAKMPAMQSYAGTELTLRALRDLLGKQ